MSKLDGEESDVLLSMITGIVTFVLGYLACVENFGIYGVALGWVPALVVAMAAGPRWPAALPVAIAASIILLQFAGPQLVSRPPGPAVTQTSADPTS